MYFIHDLLEHHCDKPGCGSVIVLDGNMKNHRDVCMASEAGYAIFSGLPLKIKTGCPNTPQLKSRYCPLHSVTAFKPEGNYCSSIGSEKQHTPEPDQQLAFISAKKETRNTTFYQVCFLEILV